MIDINWEYKAVVSLGYTGLVIGKNYSVSGFSEEEIATEVTRLQAEYDNAQYARDREQAYPPMADQLDDIFHNGVDGWKATIQAVKDTYPKPV